MNDNNNIDDLFRQAADRYPLRTDSADWDKVLAAMDDDDPSMIIPPLFEQEGRRRWRRFLWLLLLLPLGSLGYYAWTHSGIQPKQGIVASGNGANANGANVNGANAKSARVNDNGANPKGMGADGSKADAEETRAGADGVKTDGAKPGETKPGETKPEEAKTGEVKTDGIGENGVNRTNGTSPDRVNAGDRSNQVVRFNRKDSNDKKDKNNQKDANDRKLLKGLDGGKDLKDANNPDDRDDAAGSGMRSGSGRGSGAVTGSGSEMDSQKGGSGNMRGGKTTVRGNLERSPTGPRAEISGPVMIQASVSASPAPKGVSKGPVKRSREKAGSLYAGILVAPDISFVKFQSVKGTGYTAGLLIGYNINKQLAVETGIYYDKKKYFTEGGYFSKKNIPWLNGVNVLDVDGACKMLEIPVNIRYNLSRWKTPGFFVTGGMSTYLMMNEYYNTRYLASSGGVWNWEYTNTKHSQYFFSVINMSIGYQRKLGKIGDLRLEPYLRIPVAGMGSGELPIMSAGLNVGITRRIK